MAENKNFECDDAQIPGDRSPWWLHFVQWFLIFMNPKYGWNLHHVTLLVPRIFRWLLDFGEICASLCCHMYIDMFSNIISLHTRRNMPFVKNKGIVQENIEWLAPWHLCIFSFFCTVIRISATMAQFLSDMWIHGCLVFHVVHELQTRSTFIVAAAWYQRGMRGKCKVLR